jgi:hypothetical protein
MILIGARHRCTAVPGTNLSSEVYYEGDIGNFGKRCKDNA